MILEMLRGVTFADCLHKVNAVVSKVERETVAGQRSVEKFAHRFNQVLSIPSSSNSSLYHFLSVEQLGDGVHFKSRFS